MCFRAELQKERNARQRLEREMATFSGGEEEENEVRKRNASIFIAIQIN